tara:strand:+ start:142 stop:726 length:585 start_codon:yes stop_codon:yes gene_type:complete
MCFGGGQAGVAASATDSNSGKTYSGRGAPAISEELAPRNSALDDLQMDLGMKPKNTAYFRDLKERQDRSKAAMDNLGKDIFGRPASDDSPAPAATPTPEIPPVAEAPEVPEAPGMVTGEVQAPIKEDEKTGVGTAASGEAEAAEIMAEAGGEAEKKVADTATKSRRSTVKTTAQGLLAEAPTRKRRSLMGKMIA